jgi:methylmalonyl-CoA mutase C-terminal domain/subunit
MSTKRSRIILAKVGLDSHDNGLQIVAKWLMDAGYEVVYLGLFNTCDGVIKAAVEENARLIGISFLGGGHLFYAEKLIESLREQGMSNVKVILGGVIPPDDVNRLKSIGVSAVFTPGTARAAIIDAIGSVAN